MLLLFSAVLIEIPKFRNLRELYERDTTVTSTIYIKIVVSTSLVEMQKYGLRVAFRNFSQFKYRRPEPSSK